MIAKLNPKCLLLLLLLQVFTPSEAYCEPVIPCDSLVKAGISKINSRDYLEALNLLKSAEPLIEENCGSENQFLCLNNLGIVYFNLQNLPKSIEYFIKAYKLAIDMKSLSKQMVVLNNMGVSYCRDKNYQEAIHYFNDAASIAHSLNKERAEGIYLTNIAQAYVDMGDSKIAKEYCSRAIKVLNEFPEIRAEAEVVRVEATLNSGELDESLLLADKILEQSKSDSTIMPVIQNLNLLIAKVYIKKNKPSAAISILSGSRITQMDPELRLKYYTLLCDAEMMNKNLSRALAYKDSIISINYWISNVRNSNSYYEALAEFNSINTQHSLEVTKQKLRFTRRIILLIILFTVILNIGMVYLIFILNKKRAAQKKLYEREAELTNLNLKSLEQQRNIQEAEIIKAKQDLEITELNLELEKGQNALHHKNILEKEQKLEIESLKIENERNNRLILEKQIQQMEIQKRIEILSASEKETSFLLEIEKLKNELELKNKTLMEKSVFQSSRNEMLSELIVRLSGFMKESPNTELNRMVSELKIHLNEDQKWDKYIHDNNSAPSQFIDKIRIKHPNLTANDLRFLALIFLKLGTKEIAMQLNISPESCRKRKERLSKKLNVEGNYLFEYLNSISEQA